jgi:general secretion pathway protein D
MTKAAFSSLGLTLLIGTAPLAWSQSAATDAAIQEAVRRQANSILLRQKLTDAAAAETRKDLPAAAKLYEECYGLVSSIGDFTTPEAAATISGLVNVKLELARQAQKRGQYQDARTHITRALKADPKNETARAMMVENERLLAEQRGHIPTAPALERAATAANERLDANTMVQDGKLLLEMGKLDEAEAKLKQATALDPENRAAFYYLSLLKEKRYSDAERKREQNSKDAIVKVEQDWSPPTKRDVLPVPNPYASTNLVYTGKGRQAIISKLDRIRLDTVGPWDNLPLSEVIRVLNDEAKKRDPEKKGVNFMVDPHVPPAAPPAFPTATPAVDPTTGLPIPTAPTEEVVDIGSISVRINPPLTDVRLADVLDAIVSVADKPIKFSIKDYAVVFSHKSPETQQLFTRSFKVDPNTFYQGLESVGSFEVDISSTSSGGGGGRGGGSRGGGGSSGQGTSSLGVPRVDVAGGGFGNQGGQGGGQNQGGGLRFVTRTNSTDEVSQRVRTFFTALGVDLGGAAVGPIGPTGQPTTGGKAVFFNDRTGLLLVRATQEDLDIIEQAIQVLNVTPPQVNIKARFVEITQNDQKGVGFDWYLGNFLMNNRSIVGSGGTQPSLFGQPSPANPEGVFPGSSFFGTAIPPSPSDGNITGGLRNGLPPSLPSSPGLATFTGILTDPQFRVVIRALEQRDGVDLLTAPEVTTPSGRQAQIQIVDLRTIVTDNGLGQTGSGSGSALGTTDLGTGGGGVVGSTLSYGTSQLPFGPVLDVIPYVSADGFTVQMTIIPTITEFVGYDDPGDFVPQVQSVSSAGGVGIPLTGVLPLPRIRVRQVTTSAIVWDGQTIVLGGLLSDSTAKMKDKVPVLGDLPLVGRFFRSESTSIAKKNLVIFVTPRIIDPSGNPWHAEDEMPFAQNTIPSQRAVEAR